jgi:hypothetical protein
MLGLVVALMAAGEELLRLAWGVTNALAMLRLLP